MTDFDVFNGDADGLCSLQQLRLAEPADSKLVTGVKRDIALLERVTAGAGDHITVLDISLDKNRSDLERLLEAGATVRYFDHHFAGDTPRHPNLELHIDGTADKGTSLLVDECLQGRFRKWAVTGTFGDNFNSTARRAAGPLGGDEAMLTALRDLGIYLNYNSYGATVDDLLIPPDELFRRLQPYEDPLQFIEHDEAYRQLETGYRDDMARASKLRPEIENSRHAVYILPAERWARRVSGVLANRLAQAAPDRAHALLTRLSDDGFVVSVRAPLNRPQGADDLCRRFLTGGGRQAAAGINRLPENQYAPFLAAFKKAF